LGDSTGAPDGNGGRIHVEPRGFVTISPDWIGSVTALGLWTILNRGHLKAATAPDRVLGRDSGEMSRGAC